MAENDCGFCEKLYCGAYISQDDWRRLTAILLCQVSEAGAAGGGGSDASAANQVTGNTSLDSIDDKTPALGQALAADSIPVVLTALQLAALTAPSSPAAAAVTAASVIAIGVASTPVMNSNAARIGGWVKNISDEYIWVNLSAAAVTTQPTRLAPGEVLQLAGPGWRYTGAVSAIQIFGGTLNLEVVEL